MEKSIRLYIPQWQGSLPVLLTDIYQAPKIVPGVQLMLNKYLLNEGEQKLTVMTALLRQMDPLQPYSVSSSDLQ